MFFEVTFQAQVMFLIFWEIELSNLENLESMKGGEFVFNYVHLFYYKCHRINLHRDGSYIDSPDWIKSKKSNNKSHQ